VNPVHNGDTDSDMDSEFGDTFDQLTPRVDSFVTCPPAFLHSSSPRLPSSRPQEHPHRDILAQTPSRPPMLRTSPSLTRSQRRKDLKSLSMSLSVNTPPSPAPDDPYLQLSILRRELRFTEAERDSYRSHAVMAQRECAIWKHRFNKRQGKSTESSRRIHTHSRVVTNEEGLLEAEEDRQKQSEKKQKEAEKRARKAAKEKDDLIRRATQGKTRVFSGALASKNKTDLGDLADALKLDCEGTKVILLSRITEYFDNHPRFKEDARYEFHLWKSFL